MTGWLTVQEISGIFAGEVAAARGKVTDGFADESGLFTRGIMPGTIEMAPSDKVKGGVALRATEQDVFIHPYVFRLVCSNGAIMAQATQTRHVARDNWFLNAESDLETTVREAIRCCCRREAFVQSAGEMRSTMLSPANMAINLATFAETHRRAMPASYMAEILRRYDEEAQFTVYSLMNAVTSVARDTENPRLKWRLETLGGGVPAMVLPRRRSPMREGVLVG